MMCNESIFAELKPQCIGFLIKTDLISMKNNQFKPKIM